MTPLDIVKLSAFLLVIINPLSKIAILAALSQSHTKKELTSLCLRAGTVGFLLLVTFAFAGQFILRDVFHIKLYSIQFVGGFAIFTIGLRALRQGRFFAFSAESALRDIGVAPLGMPMIAGPASIAAVISIATSHSPLVASIAVLPAAAVNLVIMLLSVQFGILLSRGNILGPLVRIVGIFVAAIGAEMALDGLGAWIISLRLSTLPPA